MKDVILTLTGPDKTGIVAALAKITTDHSGNWLDSRMMRLAGTFSGMARIALPEDQMAAFTNEAANFLKANAFQYAVHSPESEEPSSPGEVAILTLSGQDHPGIVHGIFSAFQEAGVNVEELSTGLTAAPWSGTPFFEAKARLRMPESVSLDSLQADLEALASDLLVEIAFSRD